ncbi:nitrilase-related carbon-nitrogen hydrolase [Egicoccus halophilus]|uniref:Carbon-nitrogen hydrolase n=1 Tax=Egicoccus halophilus TaxID=1670830 RepID=A0A8J3AGL8_9ACTN|nr:nitrilase-related carbon-nitrogen hydrolase [Egicoccus halophilus]GGI07930.1 carbon-nitrogen hydrolase [Egicoccus halophilus]
MRIAAVQHDIVWEDREATLRALDGRVAAAAAGGARLVAFSEMFATGFSMNTHTTAEPLDGPIATWMAEQASRHDVWVAGSLALQAEEHDLPVNALLLVSPDGRHHRYDKIQPFRYAGEHERFAAGKAPLTVDVEGVRLGLFVCYDLRFADEFWAVARDTDAYLVVANWPAARRHHWRTLLDARAIENQAYVVGVNRVGEGGGLRYTGDSRVVDPLGETLVSAAGSETVLFADLDPAVVARVRTDLPFLPDRRTG